MDVPELSNLDHLSHAEKDALIRALWQRLEAADRRIAELEARLAEPLATLTERDVAVTERDS